MNIKSSPVCRIMGNISVHLVWILHKDKIALNQRIAGVLMPLLRNTIYYNIVPDSLGQNCVHRNTRVVERRMKVKTEIEKNYLFNPYGLLRPIRLSPVIELLLQCSVIVPLCTEACCVWKYSNVALIWHENNDNPLHRNDYNHSPWTSTKNTPYSIVVRWKFELKCLKIFRRKKIVLLLIKFLNPYFSTIDSLGFCY